MIENTTDTTNQVKIIDENSYTKLNVLFSIIKKNQQTKILIVSIKKITQRVNSTPSDIHSSTKQY